MFKSIPKLIFYHIVILSGILFTVSCNKPTYRDDEILKDISTLLEKEYSIKDVRLDRKRNTIWMYTPVDRLVNEKFELHEEALDKIGNVSQIAARVVFSSDSEIEFLAMIAYDKLGVELKMIRNVEDVKKVLAWYISHSDFYTRMDINLGFNPELLGKKVVKEVYKLLSAKDPQPAEKLSKYFSGGIDEEALSKFPKELGKIRKLYSVRIDESRALIYLQTNNPEVRLLFLADVEFFEVLKQLLILYLSKEETAEESSNPVGFPVISDYWILGKDDWPSDYIKLKDVEGWKDDLYSKEINFKKFIAEQIGRKVRKLFEDKSKLWKIKVKDFNATYLRDELLVTRKFSSPAKAVFNVDPDHEIKLIVMKTIVNYELKDIKQLVIASPDWRERKTYTLKELRKLKPVKWKRLIKDKNQVSMKDVLLEIFVPNYYKTPLSSGHKELKKKLIQKKK